MSHPAATGQLESFDFRVKIVDNLRNMVEHHTHQVQ
jgi:hypothetical protein